MIEGFADGTFRPDSGATRAEFLAMVMRSLNMSLDESATTDFTDIPADGVWMKKYLAKAKQLGIVKGQTINGKLVFRPNDSITRAEAISILLKAANITTSLSATTDFTDIPAEGGWMVPYIAKAKERGIINGQTIGGKLVFRPNDSISRAEVAKIIVKTLHF